MGWRAFYKESWAEVAEGIPAGRPVADGQAGKLAIIAQEDYGHNVAIDLVNGTVAIDYTELGVQNGTVEISGVKSFIYLCDDTLIVGDLFGIKKGRPNKEGWFSQTRIPIIWRPIWFSRVTVGFGTTKVIGAQCTMPKIYGGRNVKKMIMLFPDGRIGIT